MSDVSPLRSTTSGWKLPFARSQPPPMVPAMKALRPAVLLLVGLFVILAIVGCASAASAVVASSPTALPTIAPPTFTPVPPTATVPVPTPTPTVVPKVLRFSNPVPVRQGTDATELLGPDGYPWARYRPVLV